MALIGHANVEIRAVDKFFERDVRKIVGNLKDVTVKLRADVDMKPVYNKLRTLRKSSLVTNTIVLKAEVNPDAVYNKMDEVWDDFDGRAFTVHVDAEGLDTVQEKVKEIRDSLDSVHMGVDAEADTLVAEAQLNFLARTRTAHFKADLDPQTVAAFKGAMYTLTGTIPVEAVKSFFTGITANFEAVSVKAGALTTVLSAASAAILKFGGDAFVIADDLTQLIGIAAAAPAAIGTMAASITALTLGWKDFGKAFEDSKAFQKLPKEAKDTVNAMRGMGTAIRKATQTSYWRALEDSVESFMKTVNGPLTKGLEESGRVMGLQTKSMADVMKAFVSSGQFASTFADINKGMENASGAVGGFTKGFLELMEGGAKSMPAFGDWMSKIGVQFGNWAEDANKTGKITEWIDQGVIRLQQLGSIAKSTVGIFDSIADAARSAGLDGLKQLTDGMKNLDTAMKTPTFQKGLVSIFESADQAMSNMAPGLGKFFTEIGGHVEEIGGLLETAGTTVGQFFENIGTLLSRDKFWSGLQDLMTGVSSAMEKLEPGFGRLGDALGDTFSIMGTVVDNVAPGLNLLFDTLAQLTDVLGPGIKAVIPIFNEFVQAIMTMIKTIVIPIATAIGDIMEVFAALPGGVQVMLMSLAAIPVGALLVGKGIASLTAIFGALMAKMALAKGVMSGFASAATALSMGNLRGTISSLAAVGGGFTAVGTSSKKAADKTKAAADKTAKAVSGGKGGFFGKIFGGAAIGAVGGLPGILVGAGIATVVAVGTGIASSISEQRANIKAAGEKALADTKSYQQSYDKITKTLGTDSSATAAKNLADTTYKMGDVDKSFSDVASSVGQNTDVIAQKLTSSLPAFAEYGSTWNDVRVKMEGVNDKSQVFGQRMQEITDAQQKAFAVKDTGLYDQLAAQGQKLKDLKGNWDDNKAGAGAYFRDLYKMSDDQVAKLGMLPAEFDNMTRDQVMNMSRGISDQYNAITNAGKDSAETVQKAYAEANQLTISENQKVLNSSISSSEEKLAAFRSNLSATGKTALATVEQQAYTTVLAVESVKDSMKTMNTNLDGMKGSQTSRDAMMGQGKDIKSVLDYTKKGSREVFETMSQQSGVIQTAFVSAYDTAIKQNGNMQTSLDSALTSIKPMLDGVKVGLKDAGFKPEDIKRIMSSFNLDNESFEIGITADGAEAITEALQVKKALDVLETGEYKALIKVDSTNAQGEVQKVLGLGEKFSNQDFEAALKVEAANANMDFDAFVARFQTAPDQKEFLLQARAQGIEATSAEMDALDGKINKADGKKITTYLTAQAETGKLDEFKTKFDALSGKDKQAIIQAILNGDGDVSGKLDALSKPKTAPIKTELLENPRGQIEAELRGGFDTTVKAVPEAMSPMDVFRGMFNIPLEQKVNVAIGEIPPINLPTDKSVNVKVIVDKGGLDTVNAAINAITGKTVDVTVKSNASGVETVRSAINSLQNKTVTVTASGNAKGAESVRSAVNSLQNKTVTVTASGNAKGAESVRSAVNSLKNKTVTVTASGNSKGAESVRSAVNSLKNKTVTVTAVANTGPVTAINGAIKGIQNKTVTVKADTGAAMSAVQSLQGFKIANKSFSITANAGPALSAIATVNARQVSNKSNTITTYVRTVNQNADGGMYAGNVRTFAKGGLDKVQKAIQRHQKIGGGENRVAQIAKGSQNYRVWGEAETGGEAYLPLGKSKRARSLKILKQVMDHFGVQAAQTFNDGGVLMGKALGGGITSYASGGVSNSTAARKAEAKARAEARKLAAANKRVTDKQKKVAREQREYNAINNKKVNAAKKKKAKAELALAKKELATAKKAQDSAKKKDTSAKDALKKQQEITKNARKDKGSIVSNFRGDIASQFGPQKSPLQTNIAGLRADARKFINTYSKSRPKEAKAMEKVSKKLAIQASVSKGYSKEVSKYGGTEASARLANRVQKAQRTKSKKDDVLKGVTLRDYELSIERTGKALDKAEDKLADLRGKRNQVIEGLTTSLSSEFSLKDFVGGTNKGGFRNAVSAKGLSSYARDKMNKLKNFSKDIKTLILKGYNPALVEEIAQMGLEDGSALAKALIKDPSQKKSLNESYAGIEKYSEVTGTTIANKMYNAGIQSAEGLVKGLKADEQALKDAAVHLGDILWKEFKKALGIKSPSRVMMKLGRFIPQGVALGIDKESETVSKSIRALVQPKDLTLTGNTANGLPPLHKSTSNSGIMGKTLPEIHVHPSPGMDEVLVGQAAARELMYRLQ